MILITGVAGFIGYHLARALLDNGKEVIGIDNLNDYYDVKLKGKRLDLLKDKKFTFLKMDILDVAYVDKIFQIYDISIIVHLAAIPGVRNSIIEPYKYLSSNTVGTLNILEAMKRNNKSKMIMGSTSSLYANQDIPFSENMEMLPISPYAASKGAAELLCYTYSHLYDFDITVLRFFTVYGKYGRPDMSYYKFIDAIKNDKDIEVYGDGNQYRDFTYIDDVVNAIIQSFICDGFDLINIGTGEIITINELIVKLEIIMGKKASVKYINNIKADMEITQADNSKALKKLNWFPKVCIEEGLLKIIGEKK